MDPQEAVETLAAEGVLIDQDAAPRITADHVDAITTLDPQPMVVTPELLTALEARQQDEDATDTRTSERSDTKDVALRDDRDTIQTSVEVVTDPAPPKEKRTIQDFVDTYNDRYTKLRDLLLRRRDIQDAVSINRLKGMEEGDEAAVVAMVNEKHRTSSGRFVVYGEDPTGKTKILVDEEDGEHIVEDEVIGINGTLGDDIIFADDVIWPDIPLPSNVATTDEEVYAAFISDIHFGSIDTLNDKLDTFAAWLNSREEEADRVKYLFVVGDAVEGVGNYPGQEEELEVTNLEKQYERFQDFVRSIRDDIQVVVIPGNHDMVRLAEPQPPLPREVVPDLYDADNVHLVENPCYVRIHSHDGDGILVLLYHGYSFDGHVNALQHLRETAYENPDRAMADWLKRRHLAPIYGSNLLVPSEEDRLVIDRVPDVFAAGHTHSFACTTYKGTNLVCAGTFQGQTDFQKRIGHKPDPGKVAMINLQTREGKVKVV